VLNDPFFRCASSILDDKIDRLAVFQSGPLTFTMQGGSLQRVPLVNCPRETNVWYKALGDATNAGAEIHVTLETASIKGLEAFFGRTRIGQAVHLSGHCNEE
jgi:hypothetical protein